MLEHKIQQAFSHTTPDVWDSIQSKCQEEEKNENDITRNCPMVSHEKERWNFNVIGFVATITLLVATIMGVGYYNANYVVASVISLGEDAGIHIVVNAQGQVLEVNVLNHEEYIIGANLKGVPIENAIQEIVTMLDEYEYIAEDSTFVIGVKNDNAEENYAMRKRIQSVVSVYLENRNVRIEVVNQELAQDEELREMVKQYQISFLRAKAIRSALNVTSMYTIEELVYCESHLLNQINNNEGDVGKISNETCIDNWKLVEKAYYHAVQLGIEIDKFDITYTLYYDHIKKMWILEVHLLEAFTEDATQRMKFTYKVNAVNGEIEYYEAIVVPILIGVKVAQSIVMHDAYSNSGYSLIEISIKEMVDEGNYYYEIQFQTKQHKAYYKVNAQTGEIVNRILEKQ